MKGATILLGIGTWCGFGWVGGDMPDLRLGVVRLSWCRGWLGFRVRAWQQALRERARGIGA